MRSPVILLDDRVVFSGMPLITDLEEYFGKSTTLERK